MPGDLAGFGGNRRACFGNQLLGGLVQTDDRALRVMGPGVDRQNIFHGGYEGGIGLGRDHPLLLEMRLESVFFSTRPIVLSLARPTMASSTTFSSSSRNDQRA